MIKFIDICKTYTSKEQTVQALDHVSLTIQDGDIYGIIGLSGAGKSTLLSMINGLEIPTSGSVLVDGVNIPSLSFSEMLQKRRKIGMIFQQFELLNSKTVRHNISLPLIIAGEDRKTIDAKVDKMLQFVQLEDKADVYLDQLSGGQKQRVGIARALITEPSILLCDEATSALDPDTMESILDLLKEINRKLHITIVMVTHQIYAIQKICHHVAVMENGRVIEEGNVFDIFSNPRQRITQNFVRSVIPDQITPAVCSRVRTEETSNYEILRLKFTGDSALGDLVYQINRKFLQVRTRIIHATVTELDEQTLGILILQVIGPEEEIQAVEAFCKENQVHCEEVKCEYGL